MKQVRIILADISISENREDEILTQIAPCYAEKYRKHKLPEDASQELVSGLLLSLYLGISRDEQLIYNAYEKPSLASGESWFNLSHSGKYVALAIADCSVGIDLEKLLTCHEATVKKLFSQEQKKQLAELEGSEKDVCFTRMWTRCEAMLKLKGTGFAEDWETWDTERQPVEHCSIDTARIGDYILSCATGEEAEITVSIYGENN